MIQQVSDFELELMKTIWGNTIISLLSRLIKKGYLSSKKSGRQNTYTALVSETEYQTAQTETFLNKVYEGNAEGLISTLIQRDLISADDYEKLKQYWEGGRSKND